MEIKRIIDSNIIIYSILENHPANQVCKDFLASIDTQNSLFSHQDCLLELFQVLRVNYAINLDIIIKKIRQLYQSNISFKTNINSNLLDVFELVKQYGIHPVDAKLYLLSIELQAPIIVTDDWKFRNFLKTKGILGETPITDNISKLIQDWENKNLPSGGIARILKYLNSYLEKLDANIALKLKEDTKNWTKFPLL
jgi:predicted nucleic acid-binding protein